MSPNNELKFVLILLGANLRMHIFAILSHSINSKINMQSLKILCSYAINANGKKQDSRVSINLSGFGKNHALKGLYYRIKI